jgi:hypothetical protein|tara:strand:+ start:3351 stop:3908 length:558 start_codon:yes stop_codon:yes gene_type:complete
MLLSARNNQFIYNLPRTFIPEHLVKKYKPYLNKMPGNMITEPIDFLNYGIQSLNLPGPTFDPVEQIDYPGHHRKWRSSLPLSTTRDPKEMTLTMQAFDGYVNYWMAVEIFDYYYTRDGKTAYVPEGVGVQIMDSEGIVYVSAKMNRMLFQSVSALDLNFSSNTVEFQTFDMTFVYNDLEIVVNLD